jgi:hypothetical protein
MKRRRDSCYFSHSFSGEPDLVKVAKQGLDAMQSLGDYPRADRYRQSIQTELQVLTIWSRR